MTQRDDTETAEPVGWALIGTSGWVTRKFAPSVLAAGHRMVGAFGSSASGSARFADRFGCRPYASLAAMLADDAVEAVWVASPPTVHAEHARAAAKAGRPVLVEKPLTVDVAAARRLAADLADAGALAGVGFQHRFNTGVAAVANALASGRLGTLTSVLIQQGYPGPADPGGWRADAAIGGGWSIADIGAHLLDITRHLLGDVDFWAARLSSPGRALAVDDLSWLLLAKGEASVALQATTGSAGPPSAIEARGTGGWVRLVDFWPGGGRLAGSTGETVDVVPGDPYVLQVRAFSAAVRGAPWTGATVQDGVRVVELAAAARGFRPNIGPNTA